MSATTGTPKPARPNPPVVATPATCFQEVLQKQKTESSPVRFFKRMSGTHASELMKAWKKDVEKIDDDLHDIRKKLALIDSRLDSLQNDISQIGKKKSGEDLRLEKDELIASLRDLTGSGKDCTTKVQDCRQAVSLGLIASPAVLKELEDPLLKVKKVMSKFTEYMAQNGLFSMIDIAHIGIDSDRGKIRSLAKFGRAMQDLHEELLGAREDLVRFKKRRLAPRAADLLDQLVHLLGTAIEQSMASSKCCKKIGATLYSLALAYQNSNRTPNNGGQRPGNELGGPN